MATSAASAAGSDSNRAAYARDLESISDGNRLRIDESTLSAFDLLLDLPIFENQVPSLDDSAVKSAAQRTGDDESHSEDDDASSDDHDHSGNLVSLPIAPRIQETLNKEPTRLASEDRKVDVERVREVETPHDKDSHGKPAFEVTRDSNSIRPIETENSERVDPSLNDVPQTQTRNPDTSKLTVEKSLGAKSLANQSAFQESEQGRPTALDIDESSISHKRKASKEIGSNQASQTDSLTRASASQSIKDSKQPKKSNKRDIEAESIKPSTNAVPVSNRRAERLAENKRGESLENESNGDESESPESLLSQGSVEIPSELTLTSEPIDPATTLDDFQALSSEPTDTLATASEASSTQTSIVSSGVVAAASATTSATASVAGLESNQSSNINSVGGVQGTTSSSASTASRTTTPLAGRASTLSPYQEHRVLQRVLKGLEQLDNGGGSVRLRLHPPELGSLQITLRVEAQQVSALVEVEHTAARDVLLSNLPQLQSRLTEQGLTVSQFDVQVVDPNQWSQGSGLGWEAGTGQGANQNDSESQRSSRYIERLRNQIDRAPTTESNSSSQALWTRKNGQLDVRV